MSGFFAEDRFWDVTAKESLLIATAVAQLENAGLAGVLGEVHRMWALSGGEPEAFHRLVERRTSREPLSHLLGYRDFYKHRFVVTSDVLDPRPDTETLIEAALAVPFNRVLDLGTGSGCILLSLLTERREAVGTGTDVSDAALAVAKMNADRLQVMDRAHLIQSDWFASINGAFDLIVSNPPYIAATEMTDLQPEVRDHEPRIALTDEADGLTCYRAITANAMDYLTPSGHLMFEIGPTQAEAVSAMMAARGFGAIRVIQDLDDRDRVVLGQKTAS